MTPLNYGGRAMKVCKGFTVIELLTAIGILFILLTLILSVLYTSKRRASEANCFINQKQIGSGVIMYHADYDDYFPPAYSGSYQLLNPHRLLGGHEGFPMSSVEKGEVWFQVIQPYLKLREDKGLQCPNTPSFSQFSSRIPYNNTGFAINRSLYNDKGNSSEWFFQPIAHVQVSRPSQCIMLTETRRGSVATLAPDMPCAGYSVCFLWYFNEDYDLIKFDKPAAYKHNGGSNFTFIDGHTKWRRPEGIDEPGSSALNSPTFLP